MTPLRILVAEDNVLIAMLLEEMLAGMGHTVCATEATETSAVAAATRLQPDLMIVDGRLGRGSGVSAVDAILNVSFIPHVFVTGDAARIQAMRPDAVVIQKPFFEPDLAMAIERALRCVVVDGAAA